MGSLFGFGGKSAVAFSVGSIAEVEFFMDDSVQAHFVPVLNVEKQSITLSMPGTEMRPINLYPGMEIKVSYTDVHKNAYYSFDVSIEEAMGRQFTFVCPASPSSESVGEGEGEAFKAECPIPLDFQAVGMGDYLQRAVGMEIGYQEMVIQTNLPVPDGTQLKVTFDFPGLSDVVVNGLVRTSSPIPEEKKKHRTVLDITGVMPEHVQAIVALGSYLKHRATREASRV